MPTGLTVAIPPGYEGQVRPRSGLAHRDGVTLLNAPGTIDADYRGEIKVCLINHDLREPIELRRGDRIAQLVVQRVEHVVFTEVAELPESERRRIKLDPRVIADFQASRERFLRGYKPQIFAMQWRFYDRFLRANRVRGGVASYGFFLRLLVGTPLDADGLPVVRAASSPARAAAATRTPASAAPHSPR